MSAARCRTCGNPILLMRRHPDAAWVVLDQGAVDTTHAHVAQHMAVSGVWSYVPTDLSLIVQERRLVSEPDAAQIVRTEFDWLKFHHCASPPDDD